MASSDESMIAASQARASGRRGSGELSLLTSSMAGSSKGTVPVGSFVCLLTFTRLVLGQSCKHRVPLANAAPCGVLHRAFVLRLLGERCFPVTSIATPLA